MSIELMQRLFCIRQTHYDMRNPHHFVNFSVSISNLGPRIWKLVSDRLKEFSSISSFKNKIKRWQREICPCRLCKNYISRVGFL